ncbi:hypothetical protein GGI14_003954 [Coemansia sp. S680]|nr:hypothetical protein GGI14_003954 [Coemansia sp. S680]
MTQLDHALRVANLAKVEGADKDTILAALMLDTDGIKVTIPPCGNFEIGDTIQIYWNGYDKTPSNAMDSDEFDNTFVRKLGFFNKTSELVENIGIITREDLVAGVEATILMCGDLLSPTEMREFEQDPLFKQKLQLAVWDVAATKTTRDKPPALDTYRDMATRNLLMSMVTLY